VRRRTGRLLCFALVGLLVVVLVPSAAAQSGGTTAPSASPPETAPSESTVPGGRAKLLGSGKAVAPADAPQAVRKAIAAGNRIRKRPYRWGGGHASFEDTGYDCSGAVSYVLHAAGLLKTPMPSGPFMKWGTKGRGRWITVYANRGHMYAIIAGLRWDTSPYGAGARGPRWRATKRPSAGFAMTLTLMQRVKVFLERLQNPNLPPRHDLIASIGGGVVGLGIAVAILSCALVLCPPLIEGL
jgi:hypothetical protein